MERKNITLSMPKTIIKKAKALALKKEKSLSALIRESLEEKINYLEGAKRTKQKS